MKENLALVLAAVAIGGVIALSLFNAPEPAPIQSPPLGATPGTDVDSECTSQNGVITCKKIVALTTATTTPCSIKSPAATSTLVRAMVRLKTGTTTDNTVWTFAKSNTQYATTTNLVPNITLAATNVGVLGFFGTSTPVGGTAIPDPTYVFAPNRYVVVGVAATSPAGSTNLTGVCSATFEVI